MCNVKYFICLLIATLFSMPAESNSQHTTFIILRHAETVDADSDDPELSIQGKERAKRLADHFKTADISAIYSTPINRTRSTVKPLAKLKGQEIKSYDPFNFEITDKLLEKEPGGIIFIAAHSNTAPSFVNHLIGEKKYEQLNENEYDNIFIVTVTEIGKGRVLHLRY